MKIKFIIGVFLFSLLTSASSFGQTKRIAENFKYKGEPINPKLVMEFIPWVSDEKPITISVDIAAAFKTNEYYAEVSEESDLVGFANEEEVFYYNWLGELDNGIHVVKTINVMVGGSGRFQDLLFIKFHTQDFDLNGEIYEQVIMTLVKSYRLGDRTNPKITVLKDKVIIDKPLDYEKKVVVEFQ